MGFERRLLALGFPQAGTFNGSTAVQATTLASWLEDRVIRFELFGDEIDAILEVDPLRGEILADRAIAERFYNFLVPNFALSNTDRMPAILVPLECCDFPLSNSAKIVGI